MENRKTKIEENPRGDFRKDEPWDLAGGHYEALRDEKRHLEEQVK